MPSVTFKFDGEKLPGSLKLSRNGFEFPIEDGTFKDGIVKFNRTYSSPHGAFKIVSTFTGTVIDNVIKGTIEYKNPLRTSLENWEAKRKKNP